MPKATLMAHQIEGVKFLETVDGIGALLWDPGVGKTGATLTYIDRLAADYGEMRVLVVAPLTAADTWVLQPPLFMDSVVKARMLQGTTVSSLTKIRKARNWNDVPTEKISVNHPGSKKPPGKVTIVSMSGGAFSSFGTDAGQRMKVVRAVKAYDPHMIICDESHVIKSDTANLSKQMYQLWPLAKHRIILTGTFNPKDILDTYGQWRFMAPWTFSDQYAEPWTKKPLKMSRMHQMAVRPWTFGYFADRYATKGGYKGKDVGKIRPDFEDEIKGRIAERAHVVYKEDALDLPPVTDIDIHITLDRTERRLYEEMRLELAALLDSGELLEAINPLVKMMKLRQITAGFLRDTETEQVHVIGHTKQKAVVEVATTQLASENRIVVFAYFKSECAAIVDRLRKAGEKNVDLVVGATKADDRLAIRQRFGDVSGNPERRILVAQQRTMSISVNELVSAQHAIYASQSERRADWVQSRGRLDRKGQTKPVTFWNILAPETVDTIMLDRHKDRGSLEKALLDHIRSVKR